MWHDDDSRVIMTTRGDENEEVNENSVYFISREDERFEIDQQAARISGIVQSRLTKGKSSIFNKIVFAPTFMS